MDILFADLSDAFDETNSFGVTLSVPSLLCDLLHDVFQYVSVHPIPIDFCYGLLSDALSAMKLLTFLVSMCIVVHRRLLSTVMIGRKFPNRSLFPSSFILSIRQVRVSR